MNFDWFHAMQLEESDNHALFFECKRRRFSIKNTTATRPRHKDSTGSTVLPLGLAQPKEQPRLPQQLERPTYNCSSVGSPAVALAKGKPCVRDFEGCQASGSPATLYRS